LTCRTCRLSPFEALPPLFKINGRQRLILGTLRPYSEFVPGTWHADDKSGLLQIPFYFLPQPGNKHVNAAAIGLYLMPDNGLTQLIARQHPAGVAYECGKQGGLSAGQRHLPAAAIDKGEARKVELAVLDS
jgi:hypothetical protein